MNIDRTMMARLIKEKRLAKGLTQKELADLTMLSERSIQRMESAALVPRSYTLRQIAAVLDIPYESFSQKNEIAENGGGSTLNGEVNRVQKLILSVFIPLLIILLSAAFLHQSPGFPETAFELFIFWGFVTAILAGFLFFLWRPKAHKPFS